MRSEELQRERTTDLNPQNIFELVHEDLRKREAKGTETYGGPLMGFDGRNHLQELYEELLDAVMYLRCLLYEYEQARLAFV